MKWWTSTYLLLAAGTGLLVASTAAFSPIPFVHHIIPVLPEANVALTERGQVASFFEGSETSDEKAAAAVKSAYQCASPHHPRCQIVLTRRAAAAAMVVGVVSGSSWMTGSSSGSVSFLSPAAAWAVSDDTEKGDKTPSSYEDVLTMPEKSVVAPLTSQSSEDMVMAERVALKAALKKKKADPRTLVDSFKGERAKQKEINQRTKEEQREALCEELGRGC